MNADVSPQVPKGSRIYAIGDIHGRLDLLQRLLKTIAQDSASAPARRVLVTLGDYVDRGPDSAGVVEHLLGLESEPIFSIFERHFLKGNHEHMMAEYLDGEDAGVLWLNNGGAATLESYGLENPWDEPTTVRRKACAQIPETHDRFFRELKLQHHEGDYHFVHAGVRPKLALDRQSAHDVLWIRKEFLEAEGNLGAMIVHGHSPVDVPEMRPNRIAIDTRAWVSGTLTCLVLQGTKQRFLST